MSEPEMGEGGYLKMGDPPCPNYCDDLAHEFRCFYDSEHSEGIHRCRERCLPTFFTGLQAKKTKAL